MGSEMGDGWEWVRRESGWERLSNATLLTQKAGAGRMPGRHETRLRACCRQLPGGPQPVGLVRGDKLPKKAWLRAGPPPGGVGHRVCAVHNQERVILCPAKPGVREVWTLAAWRRRHGLSALGQSWRWQRSRPAGQRERCAPGPHLCLSSNRAISTHSLGPTLGMQGYRGAVRGSAELGAFTYQAARWLYRCGQSRSHARTHARPPTHACTHTHTHTHTHTKIHMHMHTHLKSTCPVTGPLTPPTAVLVEGYLQINLGNPEGTKCAPKQGRTWREGEARCKVGRTRALLARGCRRSGARRAPHVPSSGTTLNRFDSMSPGSRPSAGCM
jgi:hypothetical protein